MFWYLIFAGLCSVLIGSVIAFAPSRYVDELDEFRQSVRQTPMLRLVGFWIMFTLVVAPIAVTVTFFCLLKFACFDLPVCVLDALRMRRTLRTYRDPSFDIPMNLGDLDPKTQAFFDRRMPEFFATGFSMMGTFEYRPHPARGLARYYLADDGTKFAETMWFDGNFETGVTTILADGTVIATNTVAADVLDCISLPDNSPDDPFHFEAFADLTVAQLIEKHERSVGQQCVDRRTVRMILDRDQFRAAKVFESRSHRLRLQRHGLQKPAGIQLGPPPGTPAVAS